MSTVCESLSMKLDLFFFGPGCARNTDLARSRAADIYVQFCKEMCACECVSVYLYDIRWPPLTFC